jgi:hypothetical protein
MCIMEGIVSHPLSEDEDWMIHRGFMVCCATPLIRHMGVQGFQRHHLLSAWLSSTENGMNLYEVQCTRLFPARINHITEIASARD